MPSPFGGLSRKFKTLFQRHSRNGPSPAGHQNLDHSGGGEVEIISSSSPPSMNPGLLPLAAITTPTGSRVDLDRNEGHSGLQEPHDEAQSQLPVVHPSTNWGDHQMLGERPRGDMLSPSPPPPPLAPSNSYFSNARDFTVSNLNVNNGVAHAKTLFEYLNPHIAHGAAHNSDERWNAPACHEETRVAIREDIVSWIKHGEGDEDPKKIMWLSGPAGSGKSAIAGSVAETCKGKGLLAATFFFSSFAGASERSSKRGLVATLAHHLSQHDVLHQYKMHLHAAVDRQPDIFRKNLREQASGLILEPLRSIHDTGSRVGWPKAVIIDGLDEVIAAHKKVPADQQAPGASEDDQVEILHVLLTLSKDPSFPFRIFVASRPESNISDFFSTNARDATVNLFLDSKYDPDADIKRFLESKFADIRRRTGISSPLWPGEPALDRLVEMSSGQFIVPATILRWVEAGFPQVQLSEVLQLEQRSTKINPFASLDALYQHILKRAHNPENDPHLVVNWILSITSGVDPTASHVDSSLHSVRFWRQFLGNAEGEFNYRLAPITSLIAVPPPHEISATVTIYHKSLTDFLSDERRCGDDFYVDQVAHNSFLAGRIIRVLKNKGPTPPLSLPTAEQLDFLRAFVWLKLVVCTSSVGNLLCDHRGVFLNFLSECSRADLASCDAAWWACLLLGGTVQHGGEPLRLVNGKSDGFPALAQGIYCGIHRAMKVSTHTIEVQKLMISMT
ncbi:hypothetical protein FA13DRAFT_1739487 [Coprinellus micaceus]|uniref:Nephrocystin 3-like N-terminal domain-containing protein n=1 Tax=Coprinellus micaceus TaxID=71717 RepID=A0A4Y7SQI5_COPMI|nr:hypothetical protein FA13DRAFT_1739487 [Coprinellus micaceus]